MRIEIGNNKTFWKIREFDIFYNEVSSINIIRSINETFVEDTDDNDNWYFNLELSITLKTIKIDYQ